MSPASAEPKAVENVKRDLAEFKRKPASPSMKNEADEYASPLKIG